MIKKFKILLIILFFIQCSKPKADIEFELLNKEIYFAPIFSSQIGGVEMLYEDYLKEEDKVKARNVIRYRITNNLSYKIFFIPNSQELTQILDLEHPYDLYLLSYLISNKESRSIKRAPISFMPENPSISHANFIKDSTDWAQDTIRYYSMYDRSRFKDFTFLAPGETITFNIGFNLPIVRGSNEMVGFVLPLYKEEEYIFQLHYIQNKARLETELPKQILDYLERNDIQIIDLSLHSEKIPLIARE